MMENCLKPNQKQTVSTCKKSNFSLIHHLNVEAVWNTLCDPLIEADIPSSQPGMKHSDNLQIMSKPVTMWVEACVLADNPRFD